MGKKSQKDSGGPFDSPFVLRQAPRPVIHKSRGEQDSGLTQGDPSRKKNTMGQKIGPLLHQKDGPLTQELTLDPAPFGLGKLPRRLMPEKTTDMICGFCSTGCSLTVHLKGDEAVNLTPTVNYPVNSGEACPKGWEALTPLKAPDRAATPYLRDSSGKLAPVDWGTALKALFSILKRFRKNTAKRAWPF